MARNRRLIILGVALAAVLIATLVTGLLTRSPDHPPYYKGGQAPGTDKIQYPDPVTTQMSQEEFDRKDAYASGTLCMENMMDAGWSLAYSSDTCLGEALRWESLAGRSAYQQAILDYSEQAVQP